MACGHDCGRDARACSHLRDQARLFLSPLTRGTPRFLQQGVSDSLLKTPYGPPSQGGQR